MQWHSLHGATVITRSYHLAASRGADLALSYLVKPFQSLTPLSTSPLIVITKTSCHRHLHLTFQILTVTTVRSMDPISSNMSLAHELTYDPGTSAKMVHISVVYGDQILVVDSIIISSSLGYIQEVLCSFASDSDLSSPFLEEYFFGYSEFPRSRFLRYDLRNCSCNKSALTTCLRKSRRDSLIQRPCHPLYKRFRLSH